VTGASTAGDAPLVYPVDKGSGATTSLVEADGVVEVHPDTDYLAAGERVTVRLFSPEVRPPTVLGVGEDDPLCSRLLDRLDRPRYLAEGSRGGLRWLRDGVADAAVVAGPLADDVDATDVGGWTREWGLVVPAGNPAAVGGLGDLVDRDLRFVNRDSNAGLRTSLSNALAALAEERGVERHAVVDAVDGFDRAVRAHESPARRVAAGSADVGLGLAATADALDLGFVPLGEERVRVLVTPARREKPGVAALVDALTAVPSLADALRGYAPATE
jgi:putative molybdopterin biosynthesis protein